MKECVEHSIYIPLLRLLGLGSRTKVYDVLHDVTPMFSCSNVNVCVSMQWKFSESNKNVFMMAVFLYNKTIPLYHSTHFESKRLFMVIII